MARRNSYPGDRWNSRPGQAYSRTAGWPTRYYQRKIGGSMVTALAGINTTSDDFEKKDGESPYLWNARLNGTKEDRKRAQSMSRMGQKYFVAPAGSESVTERVSGGLLVEVSETRSVRWEVSANGRITSVGLRFKLDNPGNSNAHFVLILRGENNKEICRAIRSVTELYKNQGKLEWFRFIRTVENKCTLEASLVDDYDDNGNPTELSLYIDATGAENHSFSVHELPNLTQALREKPYKWERGINCPVTSLKTCTWKTFSTWLQRGYFNAGGNRYSVMGVINGEGKKVIYKVKYAEFVNETGELKVENVTPEISVLIDSSKINQASEQVRMTQAGNELYFVDGHSKLQRVNLDTWAVSDAVPDVHDTDTFGFTPNFFYYANSIIVDGSNFYRCVEDHQSEASFSDTERGKWQVESTDSITAWPGASLIYFLNNRLILSGFRNPTVGIDTPKAEPNLIIMSSITSVKPQYDMYNRSIEFFYVPDMAPSQSAAAPVTGFASIGDYLLVFTTDGLVIETIQSAVEFAGISQSVPEGAQYGVMKQEHIAEGRNNVYFFNPVMGIMRTVGSTATVVSGPIDSLMARMNDKAKANAYLCMTDEILRFYYDEDGKANSRSFVDYATIPQHRSYWYRDQNTPVISTCIDETADMYMAVHSEYPCMLLLDSTLKDFDCAILYEYYTKYITTPNRLDHTIVRRIHVTTLQTFQSSVYVGLDYDHNNKPMVWRKFITPTEKGTFEPEDIFGDDEETGATNLDIRTLTTDTQFVQIRLKQYCYDFQAEILQVGFEYANRTTL